MSVYKDHYTEISILRENPTIRMWKIELRAITYGDRDQEIYRIGSVLDYIESLLTASTNMALSDTLFFDALRELVEEWTPFPEKVENENMRMLEILGNFNVIAAFPKILAIAHWTDEQSESTENLNSPLLTLKNIALQVIHNFFPLRLSLKEGHRALFQDYIGILRKCLKKREFCGYAVSRLLSLGETDVSDVEIKQAIADYPEETLKSVLHFALNHQSKDALISDIRIIYSHCLTRRTDLLKKFNNIVESFGAKLREFDLTSGCMDRTISLDPTLIVTWRGEEIDIKLLEERTFPKYLVANFDNQCRLLPQKLIQLHQSETELHQSETVH